KALAGARKSLNVVVTWQALSWGKRPLKDFKTVFEREVKKTPADAGILRTLDYMVPKEGMAHDAMVPLTLKKYLPLLVPPKAASATGVTGDAKSGDGKSGDAKSGDAKSADVKSGDGKSGDAKSADAKSADVKSGAVKAE
ncbi:MAG: hypothetical protein R3F14_47490, partial [Polyangiaceae bacterium]